MTRKSPARLSRANTVLLGNYLIEKSKDPKYEGIGFAALGQAIEVDLEIQIERGPLRNFCVDLDLTTYFKTRGRDASINSSRDKIINDLLCRLEALEEWAITQPLTIPYDQQEWVKRVSSCSDD